MLAAAMVGSFVAGPDFWPLKQYQVEVLSCMEIQQAVQS